MTGAPPARPKVLRDAARPQTAPCQPFGASAHTRCRGQGVQPRPPDLQNAAWRWIKTDCLRALSPSAQEGRHDPELVGSRGIVVVVFVDIMPVGDDAAIGSEVKQLTHGPTVLASPAGRHRPAWSRFAERRSGCVWSRRRPKASRTIAGWSRLGRWRHRPPSAEPFASVELAGLIAPLAPRY